MTVHWTVLDDGQGQFRGLELAGVRKKPGLTLQLAAGRRVRIASRSGPLLWARIGTWWENWSRVSAPDARVDAVAKISAAEVRAATHDAGTDGWWLHWAKHFARALGEGGGPLYAEPWWLEPVRAQQPRRPWFDPALPLPGPWRPLLDDLGVREAEPLQVNAVVPLRRPSAVSADRVKVWRKHARAGTLPPVLLWFVPAGLDLFFVADGHDRLHAAAEEGIAPRFLTLAQAAVVRLTTPDDHSLQMMMEGLQRAFEAPGRRPRDLSSINTSVIDAHRTSHRRIAARAWPVPGGGRAWEKEVRAVCAGLGIDPEVIGLLGPSAP